MRVYFLSVKPAALKLNGAYLGIIDGFERFVDLDPETDVLAEVLPDGGTPPVNFFINRSFFENPPAFADVYLTDGDAVIYISRFKEKEEKLKVVAQTRFNNMLVTLFLNGGVYLSCEGATCSLYPLSEKFGAAAFTETTIGGFPVLFIEGDGCLTAISEEGKRIFYNPAESYEYGDVLKIVVNFNTCAGCKAFCEFGYDGREMKLIKSRTEESFVPPPAVMHFAFFESVLTRADPSRYLCAELKDKAPALNSYLGEFVDVTIPYSKFFEKYGNVRAAGLVYRIKDNLFDIRYFATDVDEEGKITNVYEIEQKKTAR